MQICCARTTNHLPSGRPQIHLRRKVSHYCHANSLRCKSGVSALGGREFAITSGSPGRGNGLGGGVEPRTAKTAPPQEELGAGLRLRVACEPGAGFAHAHTELGLIHFRCWLGRRRSQDCVGRCERGPAAGGECRARYPPSIPSPPAGGWRDFGELGKCMTPLQPWGVWKGRAASTRTR